MNGREREEGDRARRQSAVLHFLSAMHDIAAERDLVQSLIQAAAVWHDLDARAYRRDLSGRFVAAMWLPGAEANGYPREINLASFVGQGPCVRVDSMPDLDQLGWHAFQNEVLLLPLAEGGSVNWAIVVAGAIDREAEATLTAACRTAGALLEQITGRRLREFEARMRIRMAETPGAIDEVVQAALVALVAATSAVGGRVVAFRRPDAPPVTLAAAGLAPPEEAAGPLARGARDVRPTRLAMSAPVGSGGSVGLVLEAAEQARFGPSQERLASAGLAVVATWLGGATTATRRAHAQNEAEVPRPIDAVIGAEMDRVRQLSLRGGVLVASFREAGARKGAAVSSVIEAMREELRSSDLLGQLAGGEVAALLVRSTADGVLSAAWRVRKRLEQVARERRMPPVELGHALYPADGVDSLGALVELARSGGGAPGRAPLL